MDSGRLDELQACRDAAAVAALYGPLGAEARGAFLITGASSGFGLETALALARSGATVVMACRPGAKAEAAVERVRVAAAAASGDVYLLPLDLAEPASVRACAAAYESLRPRLPRGGALAALVLNAGVIGVPFGAYADGEDSQLRVNLLGHALLHELLRPALDANSAETRVVVVSSGSNWWLSARKELDLARELPPRRDNFDFGHSYCFSNVCRILWARALARRVDYPVVSLHPACSQTDIGASFGRLPLLSILSALCSILPRAAWYEGRSSLEGQSAAQGARTQTFVATAPRATVEPLSGKFLSGNETNGPLGRPVAPCAVAQRDDYADVVLAFADTFVRRELLR